MRPFFCWSFSFGDARNVFDADLLEEEAAARFIKIPRFSSSILTRHEYPRDPGQYIGSSCVHVFPSSSLSRTVRLTRPFWDFGLAKANKSESSPSAVDLRRRRLPWHTGSISVLPEVECSCHVSPKSRVTATARNLSDRWRILSISESSLS